MADVMRAWKRATATFFFAASARFTLQNYTFQHKKARKTATFPYISGGDARVSPWAETRFVGFQLLTHVHHEH